ncbi:dienelactone hydrolase family protein [Bradyrhizobium manausense]|uniref:dienelactone hydrolase family protein n=1 Tax=Bradyrhizobium TaxID=374 RepID=UPI001BADFC02|nr:MULTISPECIES: dienelactone hydrolase family protein [Bradyrhizobium]MBR0830830.1 dienelactone hydrolase family protein [Bradyrhizobium manausense]UVO28634.1 dienelactone hydrolase family protein [Bradyrhizobium arachidis]
MTAVWRIALAISLLLSAASASAQGLIEAATQAKDLTFPAAPSTGPVDGSRMVLLKPDGPGPFPAIVLQHQCGGLRSKRGPNRSMGTWAKTAVEHGFVVLLIDSLGPRDVDQVCLGPKNGVNFPRGVRDALQAADHLRTLSFVDKRRIAHVGFSWGAMVVLLAGNASWRLVLPGGEGFGAAVAIYPGCFEIRPKSGSPYEIVDGRIDRPVLVLMGEKDTETPPNECVPKLQAAKDRGAPLEWYIFRNATHCWDCQQLDGFSKTDFRGTSVTYRYDSTATSDARRRIFDFLDRTWTTGRKVGGE